MIARLFLLALVAVAPGRLYPPQTIHLLASGHYDRPRAEIVGIVTVVRHEADGDLHVRVEGIAPKDDSFVIVEIVPELPPGPGRVKPRVGDKVRVRGIVRWDGLHKWAELHPVVSLEVIAHP